MTDYLQLFYGREEDAPIGYASAYRGLRRGLEGIGVELGEVAEKILFHSIPWGGFSWYPQQQGGLSTMWEHSNIPPEMAKVLQLFDFIATPCTHSAELFREHVDVPVHVVPYGISRDFFPGEEPESPFTILTNALNTRKGFTDAIGAFEESGLNYEGRLVLKGPRERIQKYLPSTLPKGVEVFSEENLSPTELRELYCSAHCYLSMSRGEGWDLVAWEALACGVPTIVPDHTGYREWNHLAQARLESWDPQPSPIRSFGDPGDWRVMDPVEAANALRDVYHDYSSHREAALRSSQVMHEDCTWEDTAHRLVEALRPLGRIEPTGDKQKQEPLVECECVRFLPMFEISGFSAGPLKVGSRHSFPIEVVRVLSESGYVQALEEQTV